MKLLGDFDLVDFWWIGASIGLVCIWHSVMCDYY